jgi:hypothetical protein
MSDETVKMMQKLQRNMTKTKKQNMKEFIEKKWISIKKTNSFTFELKMEFFGTQFLLINNGRTNFNIEEAIDIFFSIEMFQLIVNVINTIFQERKNGSFRFFKIAKSHLHDIREIDIFEFKLFYALLLKIENAHCLETKKLSVGF